MTPLKIQETIAMPSARGTSVLVVLGITLATATLTIGQPPRAPDQTRPHADKVKYLDRVASLYLCRGMSRAEVVAGLRQHELREVSFGDPGLTMTCFYGSPNLFDPVIFVEFHRDQNQIFRAIGWHIE